MRRCLNRNARFAVYAAAWVVLFAPVLAKAEDVPPKLARALEISARPDGPVPMYRAEVWNKTDGAGQNGHIKGVVTVDPSKKRNERVEIESFEILAPSREELLDEYGEAIAEYEATLGRPFDILTEAPGDDAPEELVKFRDVAFGLLRVPFGDGTLTRIVGVGLEPDDMTNVRTLGDGRYAFDRKPEENEDKTARKFRERSAATVTINERGCVIANEAGLTKPVKPNLASKILTLDIAVTRACPTIGEPPVLETMSFDTTAKALAFTIDQEWEVRVVDVLDTLVEHYEEPEEGEES